MKNSRRCFVFLVILIAVPIIVITVFSIIALLLADTTIGDFLNNALSGHEQPAFAALSDEMQGIVKSRCPNGTVTGCINNLVSPEWGQLSEVRFVIGVTISQSSNAELYYTFWSGSSTPISIVLITEVVNGREVINGWRGFILSEGEDPDSDLVRGKRHDNELSPP
jgi:hypothetical protein